MHLNTTNLEFVLGSKQYLTILIVSVSNMFRILLFSNKSLDLKKMQYFYDEASISLRYVVDDCKV